MKTFLLGLFLFAAVLAPAQIPVAKAVVETQPGASPSDLHAAQELRDHLSKIVGVEIPLKQNATGAPKNAIVVGQGPLAAKLLPGVNWAKLGMEQTLLRTKGNVLVVAGGKPRGTLYAVYRLLMKYGVRWWAPWATTIPKNPKLVLGPIDWTETPAFEYRDPYWAHSFDGDWAARNFDNGFNARLDEARGNKVEYQGFVHTYYPLVPPDKYFAAHPEWYSLINGKRTADYTQLCTTNPELRDFIVEQVKAELRANPKATIVSVSQNDSFNPCQCPTCRALAAREGSDAALTLDLANYVGEKIEKEFPNVAVDTLAYQWSRHPPKTMRPRPNVIVRLCSIECNFAFPLNAPQNAAFGDDIRGWSKLTNRLYVWDYCTDFSNYMAPLPDYFTLGPTLQFFSQNGVKGVFEEGDYTSTGGDMAELKAWLIAQMLWDPKQDPNKLIDEFLRGYYGPRAAPSIRQYLELMAKQAESWNLTFASPVTATFLRYDVMKQAEQLWQQALLAEHGNPEFLARIQRSELGVQYVWLARWDEFKNAFGATKDIWPFAATKKEAAARWLELCAKGDAGPAITAVHEGGLSPQDFVKQIGG
ncbi:MAG TPA: DUF4838 domain-containing protein [Fimbriimonadaceae bacterium]|nr:DUF4838 domain-containing protein [Fimbriimonadaceae bacterium]